MGGGSFTVSFAREGMVEANMKLTNATYMKRMFLPLKQSHQHQDEQNQKYKSKSTAGIISPIPTVRPGGQSTQQHQNQEDDQNSSQHNASPFISEGSAWRMRSAALHK
jgi:hypothetical protein